ncbi:MAG: RNA 2',3'-cyclic phosphodiesterase [Gammaproteobacteria bacterium]|nr:RNA 2',3'-cyclic phosphodiesterase [Gammaproteobacteria bacterium]
MGRLKPGTHRAKKRRLFFALWPDHHVRQQIDTLNRQLPSPEQGGRLMSSANLHLTLYYIGSVNEREVICLKRAAERVAGRGFKLALNRLGYFKRPKVLWLGCKEIPDQYGELLNLLSEEIAQCGFKIEVEGKQPHVTLRRKVSKPETDTGIETIEWQVEQFVLVESVSVEGGVQYQVVESYPLNVAD